MYNKCTFEHLKKKRLNVLNDCEVVVVNFGYLTLNTV